MLVTRIDCEVDDIGDLCITDANMLHLLGIIEERTNTILIGYHRCKMRTKTNINDKCNLSRKPCNTQPENVKETIQKRSSESMAINPPKVIDYSSDENSCDENDGSRPLSIQELKVKTLNRMNQPRKKPEPPFIMGRRGTILSRRRGSLLGAAQAVVAVRRSTGISIQAEGAINNTALIK